MKPNVRTEKAEMFPCKVNHPGEINSIPNSHVNNDASLNIFDANLHISHAEIKKQQNSLPINKSWSCKQCTVHNSYHDIKCKVCSFPRGMQPLIHSSEWKCQQCTFENVPEIEKCQMCGFSRNVQCLARPNPFNLL